MAAALGVATVLAHLLLAQITLLLAVGAVIIGRLTRWRPLWLAIPAAGGATWMAAIGVRRAAAGFAAAPRQLGAYLAGAVGQPARLLHLPAELSANGHLLARQVPLALVVAAAEAAAIGWLAGLRPAAGHPPRLGPDGCRPGLIVAIRRRRTLTALAAGDVVTRDGCGLGLDPGAGRPAEVSWAQASGGVLAVWPQHHAAAQASFPLACAALRRRKTVVVVDLTGSRWIGRALPAACAAAGVPLGVFSAAGPGCYEPFRSHQQPAALAAQLIDWTGISEQQRRTCERRLADAFAAAAASPAASAGLAAVGRSGPAGPGAGSPAPPAGILDAVIAALASPPPEPAPDAAALAAVRGQLIQLRSGPLGRWLRPPGPAATIATARASSGGTAVSVGRAVREREAVLFSLGAQAHGAAAGMVASLVLADLAAVLGELRQWRLHSDCLVWVHGCAAADRPELARLLALGQDTGTAVLLSTASAAAAASIAAAARVLVVGGSAAHCLNTAGLGGSDLFRQVPDQEAAAAALLRQRGDEFSIFDRVAGQPARSGCRSVPGPWGKSA